VIRPGAFVLPLAAALLLATASPSATAAGPPTFVVTVHESGLKAGAIWAIEIQGSSKSSSNATLVFSEPPGEYTGLVLPPPGFTPNESAIQINVLDRPVIEYLSFNVTSTGPPGGKGDGSNGGSNPSSDGSSPGLAPGVLVGILIVAALGVVAVLLLMRRRSGGGARRTTASDPEHESKNPHARRSAKAAERRSHRDHRRDHGSGADERRASRKRSSEDDAPDA
jgi:hypothetical protein